MENDQQEPRETNWTFDGDNQSHPPAAAPTSQESVVWSASEYVMHQKTAGWYVLLGLGALVLAILIFLITRDKVSTGVVLLLAVIFGVSATRQPRVLNYQIDHSGIKIAEKFYPYEQFKSFALQEEGPLDIILLVPLKRFMPSLTLYIPPDQGDKILAFLSNYLPHEEREPDPIERLMRKVRF